jgi:DNA-binding MarR family transcriptional regulator
MNEMLAVTGLVPQLGVRIGPRLPGHHRPRGTVSAGRLAQQSGFTTAAVTTVIDRLEKAGYARRRDDPNDRRRVLVELTPLMRERAEVIWGSVSSFTKSSRSSRPSSSGS